MIVNLIKDDECTYDDDELIEACQWWRRYEDPVMTALAQLQTYSGTPLIRPPAGHQNIKKNDYWQNFN